MSLALQKAYNILFTLSGPPYRVHLCRWGEPHEYLPDSVGSRMEVCHCQRGLAVMRRKGATLQKSTTRSKEVGQSAAGSMARKPMKTRRVRLLNACSIKWAVTEVLHNDEAHPIASPRNRMIREQWQGVSEPMTRYATLWKVVYTRLDPPLWQILFLVCQQFWFVFVCIFFPPLPFSFSFFFCTTCVTAVCATPPPLGAPPPLLQDICVSPRFFIIKGSRFSFCILVFS